ncbi:hypothetical protein LX16_1267 [Stackebrandtia albiflava]|uniref:Uncharacterized protein n=1 Tax=Stackebrandtia albiflava TaxID=406432 RepID=A0A562VCF7_9ACTN|nr:hypothetical protein [Stackebrandtia albiflava]TWJ15556.1 hypothetical protein LX16_1267 [Stackebrandtia albiflava]
MRHLPAVLVAAPLTALGALAVMYGEADDSPGLQLIGVLLAAAAVVIVVRSVRSAR